VCNLPISVILHSHAKANHACDRIKQTDASKLQDEYAKLVEGLQETGNNEDDMMGSPGTHSCISMAYMLP